MKYIKFFESFGDDDIKDILIDFIDDNNVKLLEGDYYTLYKFESSTFYDAAVSELKRFHIDFKTVFLWVGEDDESFIESYFILSVDKVVVNFLENFFKNLIKVTDIKNDIFYFKNNKENKTRTLYEPIGKIFWLDYTFWIEFLEKFEISNDDAEIIFLWYVNNFVENSCMYVVPRRLYVNFFNY